VKKVVRVPWVWIGGYSNGKLLDVTEELGSQLEEGDLITNDLLRDMFGGNDWHYIDKTLTTMKIPIGGIQI
jgi:hypothetical protein